MAVSERSVTPGVLVAIPAPVFSPRQAGLRSFVRPDHPFVWRQAFLPSLFQAYTTYRPGQSLSARHPHARTGGPVFVGLNHCLDWQLEDTISLPS